MSFIPIEQHILNGGTILQFLDDNEIYLRRHYFVSSGLAVSEVKFGRDCLIQVCDQTCEVIMSSDNTFYVYRRLTSEVYRNFISVLKSEVFATTHLDGKEVDNSELVRELSHA